MEQEGIERNMVPPVMGCELNSVSVMADDFEPDIEISEEV